MTTQPGPRTILERLSIPDGGLLAESWRSGTRQGRTVWHAAVRTLTPTAVTALAHLTAERWEISIEADHRKGGLFLTMIGA